MNVKPGQFGFVIIKDGKLKGELGKYIEAIEDDADGNPRGHVWMVELGKIILTKLANLDWIENQKDYEHHDQI